MLHLKTSSKEGSDKQVYVHVFTKDKDPITYIRLMLDGYRYELDGCTPTSDNIPSMKNVPSNIDKTWVITITSATLRVTCNGIEVIKIVFDQVNQLEYPECRPNMQKKAMLIMFKSDTATDTYLPPPGNSYIAIHIQYV